VSARRSAEPRPAATVVLLRDGPAGVEAMLLKRSAESAFLPNAHVFPGGAVEAQDREARALARVRGLDDAEASARLGIGAGGLAYWFAAARECFEEAGILVACDRSGRAVAPERVGRLEALRPALARGERRFLDLLEAEDLYVPADELVYFAHWITAAGRPRRFNTRFFVAAAPPGQTGGHDRAETVASLWIAPREALEAHERGQIEIIFPTRTTLADFARFTTVQAALAHARSLEEVEVNAAVWAVDAEGTKRLFRRSDPPYFEIHWSDPLETGETCYVIRPGIPKQLDRYVTRLTAPNPGVMTGPGTNSYLVGTDELVVIDPGPPIDVHLEALLAAAGGRPIRWILVTHTHPDHSPAAALLAARTGATVIGRPRPEHGVQDHSFEPAHVPEDGERLVLGGVTLRAVATPGHASNHLCYLLEETGMLFTGDHVMQGSTVVINPPDGEMAAYLASLDKIARLEAAILAPGHGYLIGAPAKEVKRLFVHRRMREQKVLAALTRLPAPTLEELVAVVYDDVHPRVHPVAARSLLAHLEKLRAEGRVLALAGRYALAPAAVAEGESRDGPPPVPL